MIDIPMNTSGGLGLSQLSNEGMSQAKQAGMQNAQGANYQNNTQNAQNPQYPQNNNANMNYQGSGANAGYKNNNNGVNAVNQNQPKQRPQSSGVHLKKGSKTVIQGANGQALTNIRVGLGWDCSSNVLDLDASVFMLGENNKVIGDDWFVFYGQTTSPDNSIVHSGDSSDGAGTGDDEVIDINLNMMNQNVKKIVFVVTINEALEHGYNFSMVSNAYVRVVDAQTNNELMRFNLTDYYANVTSMVVGEVYNHKGQWKFNAVGDGVAADLAGLCAMYGVNVAD